MATPAPESPCAEQVVLSPNHGERRPGAPLDCLILHYTGMPTSAAALRRLCDPAAQVSCHYYVEETGAILQLVPEARRAWHAGVSCWAGERDLNSRSLGIEIDNAGHPGGSPPYPAVQIAALAALCRDLCARYRIPPERVLGHSDVAPIRKIDPGEVFPWGLLHRAGAGHWVEPAPLSEVFGLNPGEAAAVASLQASLAGYGYDLEQTGVYDAATAGVVAAFQRHFRPARVDGRADASTLATLRAIVGALPS